MQNLELFVNYDNFYIDRKITFCEVCMKNKKAGFVKRLGGYLLAFSISSLSKSTDSTKSLGKNLAVLKTS